MNEKTTPSRQVWDKFLRALEGSVAENSRLRFSSLALEVVEITTGQNRLLVSLVRNTIKTTMHFPGPDRDEPNIVECRIDLRARCDGAGGR